MRKKIIWGGISVIILGIIGLLFYSSLFSTQGDAPNYKSISRCPTAAQIVIDKYEIDKNKIEGCQSRSFNLDGKSLNFVHVEYGAANDCPAGCFFSHFCAIVDGKDTYPYSFYFTNDNEDVLGVSQGRTELGYELSSRNYGKDKLIGKQHILTTNPEFIQFRDREIVHGGEARYGISEFRWCD